MIKSLVPQEINVTAPGEMTVERLNEMASVLAITTEAQYAEAGAWLTQLKDAQRSIAAAWAPMKGAAHDTHKLIVAGEAAVLEPYKAAESAIKRAITVYVQQIEARKKAEEAARKEAMRLEAERLMAEAVAKESEGDAMGAEISASMAEMVEDMRPAVTPAPIPSFATVRKTWKARIVDSSMVPVMAGGIEIRPINESALNNLARMTKGSMTIPGVEFYEDTGIAARGR